MGKRRTPSPEKPEIPTRKFQDARSLPPALPPAPALSNGSLHNRAPSIGSAARGVRAEAWSKPSLRLVPFHGWSEAILEVGNTKSFFTEELYPGEVPPPPPPGYPHDNGVVVTLG